MLRRRNHKQTPVMIDSKVKDILQEGSMTIDELYARADIF